MAQKIQTLFIDYLDGSERPAPSGSASTARNTRSTSAPRTPTSSARPWSSTSGTGGGPRYGQARSPRPACSYHAVDTAKVREWAKEQGIEIKDRGRGPGQRRRAVQDGRRSISPDHSSRYSAFRPRPHHNGTTDLRGGQMPGPVTAGRADLVHLRWGSVGKPYFEPNRSARAERPVTALPAIRGERADLSSRTLRAKPRNREQRQPEAADAGR